MCQPCKQQYQRHHGRGNQAGDVTDVVKVFYQQGDELSGDGREYEKQADERQYLAGVGQGNTTGNGKFVQQCQQYDTKYIIENGCTKHDLTFPCVALVQICQHTYGDADAGGRQCASDEQRYQDRQIKQLVGEEESQYERNEETTKGNDG